LTAKVWSAAVGLRRIKQAQRRLRAQALNALMRVRHILSRSWHTGRAGQLSGSTTWQVTENAALTFKAPRTRWAASEREPGPELQEEPRSPSRGRRRALNRTIAGGCVAMPNHTMSLTRRRGSAVRL
jgi:hypothetical protein